MSEVILAHFRHRWEADLAQGYLEDAGVPSRIVSDGAAGGQPYVGGLAGASVRVSPLEEQRARLVLERAGVLEGGSGGDDGVGDDGAAGGPGALAGTRASPARRLSPLQRAERRDLEERLKAARKAEVRHFIRCMLGVTPTAVIPIVGLALEGNVALLALLCVLIVLVEGWRWIAAGRQAQQIQLALVRLEEDADDESDDVAGRREDSP